MIATLWPVAFGKAGASRFCTAEGAPEENTWMSAAAAGIMPNNSVPSANRIVEP